MQSIERYGVVALLFLVVTVIAVLVWDTDAVPGSSASGSSVVLAAETPQQIRTAPTTESVRPEEGSAKRITMKAASVRRGPGNRGLDRGLVEAQHELQAEPVSSAHRPEAELTAFNTSTANPQHRSDFAQPQRTAGIVPAEGPSSRALAFDPSIQESKRPRAKSSSGDSYAYEIRPGDTLSEIAMRELGTLKRWTDIVAINPKLDPGKLSVGQEIRIPGSGANGVAGSSVASKQTESRSSKPSTKSKKSAASGASYRVASGDSMWKIAQRVLGDGNRWGEIAKLNPTIDADRLREGQKLALPSGAHQPSAGPRVASAQPARESAQRGKVR